MKYIFGNWKMHGSIDFVRGLCSALRDLPRKNNVEVGVFPSFLHIPLASELLKGSPIQIGGQDLAPLPTEGALTGAVSGKMLAEMGCRYVLVGHSERRSLFSESDELIANKVLAALKSGLTPILCVGESLEQREMNATFLVIETQLQKVSDLITPSQLSQLVIAYEPVWAIGTGRFASVMQVEEVHQHIQKWLLSQQVEKLPPIVYGGSVNGQNAMQFLTSDLIDGALIGGASIKVQEFTQILQFAGEV